MELSETIKETKFWQKKDSLTENFPKVHMPDQNQKTIVSLQEYFMNNTQEILKELKTYGALLFRDFDIKSPNQSIALLKQLGFRDFDLKGVQDRLQLTVGTKGQSDLNKSSLSMFRCSKNSEIKHANVHNQFSEMNPQFVALYCLRPALKDGNISLVNWARIYNYTKQKHPQFLKKIQEQGIIEVQILGENQNPELNMGNAGWKSSFKVANKEEAQKQFKDKNYSFQWLNNQNNQCRLKRRTKLAGNSSSSDIDANLNQLFSLFKQCSFKKSKLQERVMFGNDEKIPLDILEDICRKQEQAISQIEIKQRDFLILDYARVKYIHCPYQGPDELRRMYVSFMRRSQVKQKQQRRLCQVLNTGHELPLIGFGTWKISKQDAEEVVYTAIKSGYRLIDCASVYLNEVEVGKGIKRAIDEKIVRRQDLFITSKLWNTYHSPEHVRPAAQRTLKDLGIEYLDLYLMHFPVSLKFVPFQKMYPTEWINDPDSQTPYMLEGKVPVVDTWKAMQDLVSAKLVRNIGVSNFTVALLREVIYTCQIKPAVLQIQIHPELTQTKFIRYARQQGIQVTSYSTFGASSYVQIDMAKQNEPIYKNQTIIKIGKNNNRTPHQIVLRWAHQQGLAIIPKSTKLERMKENMEITEFSLPQKDMQEIFNLHRNIRYNDPGDFCEKNFASFYPLHE